MPRLRFEKLGRSVWMSHLDTMRLFQRAFKRAGLKLTHTQGFNPRPSVSIALPLSVGVESHCELLDFELEEPADCQAIRDRLNAVLVEGITVTDVYEDGRKIKHLAFLDCEVALTYDKGIQMQTLERLRNLFARESLTVEKKGKNGMTQQDIIPMIRHIAVHQINEAAVVLSARICCQNPTLNPMQLVSAVEKYLPDLAPDHAKFRRMEIYDTEETIFR